MNTSMANWLSVNKNQKIKIIIKQLDKFNDEAMNEKLMIKQGN